MANAINSVKYNDNTYTFTLPYGVCSTAAGTVAKTADVDNFSLETGARVSVKFTYANTATSPTLNVESTGAKAIYWHGAALSSSQYWEAGAVLDFVYNGTQWEIVSVAKDNNTTYTSLKNPNALTIQGNGTTLTNGTYDGSAAKTVNITPSSIGAAASSHTHNYAGSSSAGGAATTALTCTGNAATASKWASSIALQTKLDLNNYTLVDGSKTENYIGVIGTLPIANGGTGATTASGALSALGIFDAIYPVGSIYMSANSTNPGTLFGGTWVAWGAGRVPVGMGSNGTTNYSTVESTGGAESRSHSHGAKTSGAATGNTGNSSPLTTVGAIDGGGAFTSTDATTLTESQIPSHYHGLDKKLIESSEEASGYGLTLSNPGFTNRAMIRAGSSYTGWNMVYTDNRGGGGSHTHTLSPHYHTVNSHSHTLNSHTHSVPASDSQSTDVRQPYITCYMWKRTA